MPKALLTTTLTLCIQQITKPMELTQTDWRCESPGNWLCYALTDNGTRMADKHGGKSYGGPLLGDRETQKICAYLWAIKFLKRNEVEGRQLPFANLQWEEGDCLRA